MTQKQHKTNLIITLIFLTYFVICGFKIPENKLSDIKTLEHLTFATLMAFPEKALSGENSHSFSFDETKITPAEFEKILTQLYNNNYILVDIYDIVESKENKISLKELTLPNKKKPLVLSFDNVTYKSSYQNLGEIDKIIVDRNNKFATYTTKRSIQDRVMHNNEFIPILEEFIDKNPDFSHNNAKGIIFFTGENGILGYTTNSRNASAKYENKRVVEVVNKLKLSGWKFGSNNYKYIDDNTITDLEFIKNISLWNKEIKPLIGETSLYAFPNGIHCECPNKSQFLVDNGFNIQFYNSMKNNIIIKDGIIKMTRKAINGSTLRNNSKELSHLFNCEEVYDHTVRLVPFHSTLL